MIIKIKEMARKNKNWSMYKLAKELSLPQQTIYSWAHGRTQPNYDNMEALCNILDCTMNDLFQPEPKQLTLIKKFAAIKNEY